MGAGSDAADRRHLIMTENVMYNNRVKDDFSSSPHHPFR
jgi:hypothetical protein